MISYCHDGSDHPPRLRVDLNLGSLHKLPAWSKGPRGSAQEVLAQVKAAGFEGVQGGDAALCRQLGLGATGSGRINQPDEAEPFVRQQKQAGAQCATLHVGWGFESDADMDQLVRQVIEASVKHNFPLYIETHRATITQDAWRTLQLVERIPEVRFNGDFSHWYTGLEMVYGGIDWKLDRLQPVFDRVAFLHGRIGNPGSIQVDIGDGVDAAAPGEPARPYVTHFRRMWTRAMVGFLRQAQPGDYLCFVPELLAPDYYYARLLKPDARGILEEESDRWEQTLVLARIARECFAQAQEEVNRQPRVREQT